MWIMCRRKKEGKKERKKEKRKKKEKMSRTSVKSLLDQINL